MAHATSRQQIVGHRRQVTQNGAKSVDAALVPLTAFTPDDVAQQAVDVFGA
jgi:hypothetical protein